MAKTNSGVKAPRTHFEQVPVDVVKEIAAIDDAAPMMPARAGDTVGRPSEKKAKSRRVSARSPARTRK